MSIPVGFRRVLEAQDPSCNEGGRPNPTIIVVYGRHLDGFLECYSVETMAEIEELIEEMEESDPRTEAMIDMYLSHSVDVTVDDTGRIVLPAKLRERLGIDQQNPAYCLGRHKTFQIWNLAEYERRHGSRDEVGAMPDFNPKAVFDEIKRGKSAPAEA